MFIQLPPSQLLPRREQRRLAVVAPLLPQAGHVLLEVGPHRGYVVQPRVVVELAEKGAVVGVFGLVGRGPRHGGGVEADLGLGGNSVRLKNCPDTRAKNRPKMARK